MRWLLYSLLVLAATTPSDVQSLSKEDICQRQWRTDRRHVTDAMKRTVLERTGLHWVDRAHYEIDHIIPRELGGADTLANLQAQCCIDKGRISGPAHQKDVIENRLHKLLCAGDVTLAEAQDAFRSDPSGNQAALLYQKRVR